MADGRAPAPSVRIGAVTVRGPGVTGGRGRTLAEAVARGLAGQAHAPGTHIDHLTLRLPASAVVGDGSVGPAAVAAALKVAGGRHG
jgi:hypothetical protein